MNNNNNFIKIFKNIYRNSGIKGMYRGLGVTMLASPLTTSLYFSFYEKMK